jgi:hypothetical protein
LRKKNTAVAYLLVAVIVAFPSPWMIHVTMQGTALSGLGWAVAEDVLEGGCVAVALSAAEEDVDEALPDEDVPGVGKHDRRERKLDNTSLKIPPNSIRVAIRPRVRADLRFLMFNFVVFCLCGRILTRCCRLITASA